VDSQTLSTILIIAGGLSEVGGIWLIIKETRDARHAAREVLKTTPAPVRTSVERALPLSWRKTSPEDLAAQVAQLREEFDAHTKLTAERFGDLEMRAHELAREAAERAVNEALKRDKALRAFLNEQLEGTVGVRLWGAGFFLFGVVLSVIGGVIR
jgi:hypothetical protein